MEPSGRLPPYSVPLNMSPRSSNKNLSNRARTYTKVFSNLAPRLAVGNHLPNLWNIRFNEFCVFSFRSATVSTTRNGLFHIFSVSALSQMLWFYTGRIVTRMQNFLRRPPTETQKQSVMSAPSIPIVEFEMPVARRIFGSCPQPTITRFINVTQKALFRVAKYVFRNQRATVFSPTHVVLMAPTTGVVRTGTVFNCANGINVHHLDYIK